MARESSENLFGNALVNYVPAAPETVVRLRQTAAIMRTSSQPLMVGIGEALDARLARPLSAVDAEILRSGVAVMIDLV